MITNQQKNNRVLLAISQVESRILMYHAHDKELLWKPLPPRKTQCSRSCPSATFGCCSQVRQPPSLGDQFAFIATPWLVLKLTGDPLALGIVLALEGVPRAMFMLLGGAITDRLSPRIIMLIADIVRLVLTALMALVVFTGTVQMWMMYAFGLAFGLVAGFAIPAGNSIVPMLVEEQDLQAGNSIMMGASQLVGFVGPTVAGLLIGSYSKSPMGIGLAFGIDAVSFAVSALTLWIMHSGGKRQADSDANPKESVWGIHPGWDKVSLGRQRPALDVPGHYRCEFPLRRSAHGRHPCSGQPTPARRSRGLRPAHVCLCRGQSGRVPAGRVLTSPEWKNDAGLPDHFAGRFWSGARIIRVHPQYLGGF